MFPIVILLLGGISGSLAGQPASIVFENAVIYTGDAKQPRASAIAVGGERILAVGAAVSEHLSPETRRIDLKGATVLPGLIDAHAHMRGLGGLLESRDLRFTPTVAEVARYVAELAATTPKGQWITARNWDQTNWGGALPSAADLDRAAPAHPVYLTRVDGHAAWVNSAALKQAGITAATPDPPGGKILRDGQGNPTGVLVDRAMGLVRSKIPAPTFAQIKKQLELAARECARLGLTGVHDAGVSADDLRAYRELIAEDRFPLRVYAMIGGDGALWKEYLERGPETGAKLTVRAIKLYADGALGSRGAALWQDYSDDPGNTGLLLTTKEDIERVARQAAARGFQVCTHAIGDRANRIVLDAYAAALGGKNDKRFRVEHAQIVSLPDFRLFAEFSIIASIQATHATSDMRWIAQRIGPDRVAGAYAWQRFLNLGVPVANGSDFPVEEPNPMLGLYASITRQDPKGEPPGGWMPDQRMSREQALHSFTLGAAYAAFEENSKGSLEAGKLADFIVVDRDIMKVAPAEIAKARVRMTVLGGRIVHEAE